MAQRERKIIDEEDDFDYEMLITPFLRACEIS
jgi:hypothetical protein